MKHIIWFFPSIGSLLIFGQIPLRADVLGDSFTCQPLPLASELPSVQILPEFTLCAPANSISPADATEISTSTLDDIVSESPSVQSYLSQVASSEFSLKSANGSWWPNVSMSNSSVLFTDILSSQNYSGGPASLSSPATAGTAFNPFNGSTTRDKRRGRSGNSIPWTESYSNYTQAYPVIQILWNFIDPTRYPQIAAAKHQLELSRSQLLQASQQKRSQIIEAYGEFLFTGYQIAEVSKLIVLQKQIATQARERVKLKLLPRYQAEQQYRSLLSFQSQLQSLQIQQANSLVSLQSFFSPLEDNNGGISTAEPVGFLPLDLHSLLAPTLKAWPFSQAETVERSLSHSESLKQLILQSRIAKDNANQQWGAILPTIGFLGYVTYQYTAGSQNYSPPAQPSGAASSTLTNYAGLSISWNLFDGHSTRNQAKSYEQTAASYKSQYLDSATQLKVKTLQNLNQLRGSDQLISISLQDLTSAQQITLDTMARSAVGLSDQYDLINSQIQAHQSRLQLIQSIASYVKAFTQLETLVGSLDQASE